MVLGVFFFVACFFTLFPFMFLCTRAMRTSWDNKNDHVYEALRSPSVRNARNAFERRVALAIREAKQGFRQCAGCGFTNPMRAAACVLCGESIPPQKKRLFRGGRSNAGSGECGADHATGDVHRMESDRQRRVRRRKEWTRRRNAHGLMVWRYEPYGYGAASESMAAFYVFHTTTTRGAVVAGTSPGSESGGVVLDVDDHVSIEVEPTESAPSTLPQTTIEQVTRALQDDFEATVFSVVAALDADATLVACVSTETATTPVTVSHDGVVSTADTAPLDFPTKLAQFITSMATLFDTTSHIDSNGEVATSRLDVHRDQILVESLEALATVSSTRIRTAIRVEFVDEQGVDAGGVYREWFLLLNEQIVDPNAGIFTCVDPHDQAFHLNPHSREVLGENHLAHIFAAGRLLGRALLEGNVTGFHLALPLLKIILGLPVGFDDLEYFDPDVYKNLKWLLENDGADALCLNFTVVEKLPNGTTRVVELVPGGSEMDVNDANKRDFVDRKLKYLLFESVSSQLFAFLKGLYEVVPAELLMLFDAEELDYVLAGSDEIDVDDWEAHTVISKNLVLQPAFFHFWKVVRELSFDDRRRLLQFGTGSTRVPPGGFSALTSQDGRLSLFNLVGVKTSSTWGCLHSHACFNKLDVPLHRDLKAMREAVQAAIASDAVGFTTA